MNKKDSNDIDQLFWRIAVNDDDKAFQTLFFEFFPALCVFAHRYIEQWEICEDIVQDTFFKIWNNRKNISINLSSRNFLISSVRNACVDHLRKRKTERSWQQEELLKKNENYSEDLYSTIELENLLNNALAKLPENIRSIFEKSRFEGKTYAEIANEQNISIKTVEANMTKALKILRLELKEYLPLIFLFL